MKFVFLVSLLLVSCSYSSKEKEVLWREGDSPALLQKAEDVVNEASWMGEQQTEFVGFKIQHKSQIYKDREILQTPYKKVWRAGSSQTYLLSADVQIPSVLSFVGFTSNAEEHLKNFLNENPEFKDFEISRIEPVLVPEGKRLRPLWRARYLDRSEPIEVFFAGDSKIHLIRRIGSLFDTQALLFPKGPKHSSLTEVVLGELLDWNKLSSSRVMITSDIPDAKLNLKQPLRYQPRDAQFDQVQAFYHLDSSLKWFEEHFNFKTNRKLEALVNLGYPDKTNAAFYFSGKIRLGSGDEVTYSRLAQDPSIVIHESAHYIIDAVARLPFEGEGGSLNEGFADFFASVQLQNPYMGEVAYLKAPFKRNLNEVVKFSEKNGNLYHDSAILSGFLWQVNSQLGEDASLRIASRLLVEMTALSKFADLKILLPRVLNDVLEPGELRKVQRIAEERELL